MNDLARPRFVAYYCLCLDSRKQCRRWNETGGSSSLTWTNLQRRDDGLANREM